MPSVFDWLALTKFIWKQIPTKYFKRYDSGPGAHLTNIYSIVIQIRWQFGVGETPFQDIILLQNFAHTTTVQLLYHVENFMPINSPNLDESGMKFPLNLSNDRKIIPEMDPMSWIWCWVHLILLSFSYSNVLFGFLSIIYSDDMRLLYWHWHNEVIAPALLVK